MCTSHAWTTHLTLEKLLLPMWVDNLAGSASWRACANMLCVHVSIRGGGIVSKGILMLVVWDRRMCKGMWMCGVMLHRVYRSIGVEGETWRGWRRADVLGGRRPQNWMMCARPRRLVMVVWVFVSDSG